MAIKAKEKFPKLSEEMQSIIDRSHKDGNGECYGDNERYKYKIMKMLTENQDILWTLHNAELESKFTNDSTGLINGDAYRNVSIFNFLKIPDTQSKVRNYICFEVDDIEQPRFNDHMLVKNIVFRTVSHDEDYQTDWGMNRQDLLAMIIQSEFDWSNVFGLHIEKVYDKGKVAENGYYYREFIYETSVPNNLVNKSKNGGVTWYGNRI